MPGAVQLILSAFVLFTFHRNRYAVVSIRRPFFGDSISYLLLALRVLHIRFFITFFAWLPFLHGLFFFFCRLFSFHQLESLFDFATISRYLASHPCAYHWTILYRKLDANDDSFFFFFSALIASCSHSMFHFFGMANQRKYRLSERNVFEIRKKKLYLIGTF